VPLTDLVARIAGRRWPAWPRVVSGRGAAGLPALRREPLAPRIMPAPRFARPAHRKLLAKRHGTWHQGHWRDFALRGQVVSRPSMRSLFALPDACVTRHGVVFDARREYRLDYFDDEIPHAGPRERREVLLTLCQDASDFHDFMIHMLPLLLFCREEIAAHGARLTVLWYHDPATPYVRDTLARLALDPARFVNPLRSDAVVWEAGLVLFPFAHPRDPRLVRYGDPTAWHPLPDELEAVRALFVPRAVPAAERRAVVYPTRRDVARLGGGARRGPGGGGRAVVNEDEVLALLRARYGDDLAVFVGADHDLASSAALFSRARSVVGPHGGALVNTVFCAPGTTLVEFLPARDPAQFYYYTASGLGHRYWPLPIAGCRHRDDLPIPLGELEAVLDAAEADADAG
jgi:capsular polysaccharide biosynthesis protein